jgi:hypothetical protein
MFLKCHSRLKEGKEHRYWNIVENRRCGRGKFVQRQVLYLGEINDIQRESCCQTIEVFDENREWTMPLALFPADRQLPNFAARRQLKALWKRLGQLQQMKLHARNLLLKLGEAKGRYPTAWRLIDIRLPEPTTEGNATFGFALDRQKLRQVRRREGRYLLRTNLCGREPAQQWEFYIQLVEIEAAFKNLKDDLALRPIFHQLEHRIEAHIFVAFIAYCLRVTLRARLRPLAPGLTPRAVLDKFATIQMLDAHFPTTDGRTLILRRFTCPEAEHKLLLANSSSPCRLNRHPASV